MGVDKKEMYIA